MKAEIDAPARGTVRRVRSGRWVEMDPVSEFDPRRCVGEFAFIGNERRSSSFRILEGKSSGGRVQLRLEHSPRMGRLKGERVGDREVLAETQILFTGNRHYEGARLVDRKGRHWLMIERAEERRITLTEPLGEFDPSVASVYEFGPGDEISIASYLTMHRTPAGWSGKADLVARLEAAGRTRIVGPGGFRFRMPP